MPDKLIDSIENLYWPVIALLEDKDFTKTIKNDYKGFITAHGKLIENPIIFFLGINPGDGAFVEMKHKEKSGDDVRYPLRLFSNLSLEQLDWLNKGNARGEISGNVWNAYQWYQTKKNVNNVFVKRMIEFLFSYYDIKESSNYSEIEHKINSEIFYWNLYPIATKSTVELNKILKEVARQKLVLNGKLIKELYDLKNFFRQRTIDIIQIINPEVIICLGSQAFKELTYNTIQHKMYNPLIEYTVQLRKNHSKQFSVYVVSRKGNWEVKIKKLAKHLKQSN